MRVMENCVQCQKELTGDEIAIYRRLIYRDAEEYMCKECLAKYLGVPTEVIDARIAYFKKIGCTLF
jgi:hypothetical protein